MVMCVLGFCLAFGIERVLFHTHSHGPENSVAVQTDAKDDCEKCEEQSLFQQTRSALVFMAGIALHATLAGVSLGAQTRENPSLTSSSPSRRTNPPPRSASARNS